jgi:hypothetical protein
VITKARLSITGHLLIVLVGIVATLGCATVAPGARPDDMSAAEHRAAAKRDALKADEHGAKYDPDQNVIHTSFEHHDELYFPERVYNPTEEHLRHAEKYRDYARQHEEAARQLEKYEERECAALPKSTRVVCPLLGQVNQVEDIEDGVRIYLKSDRPTNAIVAHMRCHYAFGRTVGQKGMPNCPLYLKSLRIERTGDRVVSITTDDAEIVDEIRRRSRSHVAK